MLMYRNAPFISEGVNHGVHEQIQTILGINIGDLPIRYLRVPTTTGEDAW